MNRSRVAPLVLLLAALAATPAFAQSKAAPPHPPISAIRLDAPVNVDGVLNEAVWHDHPPITEFYQLEPNQGEPARFRTEAWVAYDEDALYIAARMYDPAPDSIVSRLVRRDDSVPCDRFCVYFDPYHDKRSAYFFIVTAAGSMLDGTESNDNWNDDISWDGVWEGRSHRDSTGWSVEYRIPFSQMRFQQSEDQTWGVNFRRVVARYTEQDMLSYPPRGESGFVSRWPELVDIKGVRPAKKVELLPYVTSKASYLQHAPGDPFNDGASYRPNAGGDLRMGVGPRLTLNATINPDFGQVEVDPATLNLSDVETYYQEKRPFFVEGAQVFRFGNEGASDYWNFNWPEPTFFYSRRIGAAPQGSIPDSASYVSPFEAVPILGAAKLTGKLTPTVNLGSVVALTGRETADVQWSGGGRDAVGIEPLTGFGEVRVQKEFKDRREGLGGMVNYVDRSFEDAALRDQLNGSSLTTGIDGWVFLDPGRLWVISGYSAVSHVTATQARMQALQSNSQHYFQRPDAPYLGVDSNATSLNGVVTRLWLNKEKGKWMTNSGVGIITPGFENNDIGFLSYADVINGHTMQGIRWTGLGRVKRQAQTEMSAFGALDFQGAVTAAGIYNMGYVQFVNYHEINWTIGAGPHALSGRRTRGGPRMVSPGWTNANFYWNSDPRRNLTFDLSTGLEVRGGANTQYWNVNPDMNWKPVSNVQISLGPGFERNIDDAQYVTQYDDPTAVATYDRRYVFAHLDQYTAYASIRLNVAFTPTMTLQTYIQPYVSVGRYTDYKSLARPGTWSFDPAPPEDADFNYRSLRGNMVYRWEYMPGSAFYLAWTQNRAGADDQTDQPLGHTMSEVVRTAPDNVFLAKITYYLHM
jgi:hypothetical protein